MLSKSDILVSLGTLSQIKLDCNFDENILKSLKQLEDKMNSSSFETVHDLQKLHKSALMTCSSCSVGKFVCLSLECLLHLKENLRMQKDESEKLLSIAHQQSVRVLLEGIVSVGLQPNLLPGVEPPTNHKPISLQSSFTEFQKYECLCLVTLALVDLYQNDTFHGILLPQFLSPILCALCQLTMVPLKKSADTFPRLQRERLIFQQHLDELVTRLYQPMVIKELMVIEGNKRSPKWLKRGVGQLLTVQLHRPHGVLAVVQAVRDAANCMAPTSLAHLESVAHVITASPDLHTICPQVLEMLDSSDAELVRVAVLCVKTLHTRDSLACDHHLLQPLASSLKSPGASEQQLTQSLLRLHKCFAVPASDLWRLDPALLLTHIHTLFQLYCKVYQSASHVRSTVEDLVWCCISASGVGALVSSIFRCLIYRERLPGIEVLDNIEFVFSDDGGVKLVCGDETQQSLEEFGDCLMLLLERRDTNGLLGNKLFVTLLDFVSSKRELDTIDSFEQQLVTVKLLAVLSENPAVQKSLSEDPKPVVQFLGSMIDNFLTDKTCEVDVISIVLVLVNVILNDCIYSKTNCWKVFSQLKDPLFKLKSKTENTELQLLAQEAYEVILTHGASKSKQNKSKVSDVGSEKSGSDAGISSCEEAMRDACDPLLPVRGHAMMQLGKLLAAGDTQARAKKDQILCIFQENLKSDDSFLYLAAVEGLATAAAEFPDSAILSLTEQFCRRSLPPPTRLKLGEVLVRLIRLLGELVPVYKAELINALLHGCRDEDCLVRASSLSALGELCRVLGFRVGPIIAELLTCAHCIVQSDPSVEARRSAVMLITLLLKGLQKDALIVLQDVLLEVYRCLKLVYSTDKDDVTRLHAQLALEELNSGTLAYLFPKPQLTKRIFVLDPPS